MNFFEKAASVGREALTAMTSSSKREKGLVRPTEQEQGIIDTLKNERSSIREIGHELLDTLGFDEGGIHLRQKAKNAQALFYEAVAAYTGVMSATEVKCAYQQDPNGLFFLDLTEYVSKEQKDLTEHELLREVLRTERRGDADTRARASGALQEAHLSALQAREYAGDDLKRAMNTFHEQAGREYLEEKGALYHLAETAPEVAERLYEITELPFVSFVRELELFLEDPELAIHLEQRDYKNPIFLGVREVVHIALLEKQARWRSQFPRSVSDPFAYSSRAHAEVTRDIYLQELKEKLGDKTSLEHQATAQKEWFTEKARRLESYDLFLDELERYSAHGLASIPPSSSEKRVDEWDIGHAEPNTLLPVLRELVQSLPPLEASKLTRIKRDELMRELHEHLHGGETGPQLQVRFYALFSRIISEITKEWRSAYERDRIYFLHRDIKEAAISQKRLADRSIPETREAIKKGIMKECEENLIFVQALGDLEEIVDHPEIKESVQDVGKRLGIDGTAKLVLEDLQDQLTQTQGACQQARINTASYLKRSSTDSHLRLLSAWLHQHPINRWHPQAA